MKQAAANPLLEAYSPPLKEEMQLSKVSAPHSQEENLPAKASVLPKKEATSASQVFSLPSQVANLPLKASVLPKKGATSASQAFPLPSQEATSEDFSLFEASEIFPSQEEEILLSKASLLLKKAATAQAK